ncbi:MAG: hypothetical protein WB992_19865 [Bryobacteraceae bacterium]
MQKTDGHHLAKMPIIAVDIGGTVEDTWSAKRSWFATKGLDIGQTPLGRREIVKRVGGDEDLYKAMASDVYSDAKIASHKLTDGCSEALRLLATRFRVILLTSRPGNQHAITREWLASQGIGGLIDDVVCVGPSFSKAEWCRAMNAKVIVDDDMRHLETIGVEDQLRAIHFRMGEDRSAPVGSAVLSVCNWPGVVAIVSGLSPTAERAKGLGVEP